MEHKHYSLELIEGVEGNSLYLNDYRIAGPKPWGGGAVIKSWKVRLDDLQRAIPELKQDETPDKSVPLLKPEYLTEGYTPTKK